MFPELHLVGCVLVSGKHILTKKKKPASLKASYIKNVQRTLGGDKRDRTADLLNAIQALSQLSYTPIGECVLN